MTTIEDLLPQVRMELGGRTDQDANIRQWIKDAYLDVGMTFPLETLEVSLTTQTVQDTDTYAYPNDCRAIKALTLMNNLSTPASPVPLTKKNIQVVRRYQIGTTGVPAIWAPFGTNFMLRATPNYTYDLIIDYWQIPQMAVAADGSEDLPNTVVNVPSDWLEIVVFEAAKRGHTKLQEYDKAQAVHQITHGDPNSQLGFPGLIKEKLTRKGAENGVSDFGLRPRVRPYGSSR